MNQGHHLLRESSSLLENFANLIGHRFDRQRADRILYESHLNELSKPHEDWLDTVTSCAEALEFRIRRTDTSLEEILELVRSDIPAAILVGEDPDTENWNLITRVYRSKVQLTTLKNGQTQWISIKRLLKHLHLETARTQASWLVCYPIMLREASAMESSADAHGHLHGHGMTPFRRLVGLLSTERSDIGAIIVFSMIVGLLSLSIPIAVETLINTLAFGQFTQPVLVLAFILFVLLSFSSLLTASSYYAAEFIQRRLFVRLVEDFAYRLTRVQQSAIDHSSLPELTNRFLEIATIQKSVAKLLLDGVVIVLQTLIGMIVLAVYHPFLFGFDIVLLALMAFTMFGMGRGAVRTSIQESVWKYRVLQWLQSIARTSTAFKLNDGWEYAVQQSDHLTVGYLDARKKHFVIVFRQVIFALVIYCLATTVLLGLGGWLVIAGELSLGQLVAAELIVIMIVRSFTKLGRHLESFYELMASVDKVGMLLDLPLESHDKLLELSSTAPIAVEFAEVDFELEGPGSIREMDFQVAAGEKVAILGNSNFNLSLVADLCLKLRTPTRGRVRFNGIDIREYRTDSLRSAVSLIRNIDVFSGTLEENVHLNRPQIGIFDVRTALSAVGLLELAGQLTDSQQTHLEETGFPLSANQCRRLMLARGLVGRPPCLILDQTLDSFSDSDLQELIPNLEKIEGTLIVLTEREQVVERFNKTYRMGKAENAGKI
jgi:putative ABC transport system ATP-binding protein